MEMNYKRYKKRDGQQPSAAGKGGSIPNTIAPGNTSTGPASQPPPFQKRSPEFVPTPTTSAATATQPEIPMEFFVNEDGERCSWGPGVRYKDSQVFHPSRYYERRLRPSSSEVYAFPRRRQTLEEINKPKPSHISKLVSHPSEPNWAHPLGHPRHILSLPPEILNKIFSHILTVSSYAESIQPLTITSNRISYWQQLSYTIRIEKLNHGLIDPSRIHVSRTRRQDSSGAYLELRNVFLPAIDATFLRTSKKMWELGINFLYYQPMYFKMTNPSLHSSPPTTLDGRREYRPEPSKPYFISDHEFLPLFKQIRERAPLHRLPGWIYYSPFLRFLWTIGPENAKRLKIIKFEGTTKGHECDNQDLHKDCMYNDCHHDLVHCLRLYIPFIREFCTGLEKLTLIVRKDKWFRGKIPSESKPKDRGGAREQAREEARELAILPLLEDAIRMIESLKKLSVVKWEKRDEVLECARQAMKWFRVRASGSTTQEIDAANADQEEVLENQSKGKPGIQTDADVSPDNRIGTPEGLQVVNTVLEESRPSSPEPKEEKPKKRSRKQRAKKKVQEKLLVQESVSRPSLESRIMFRGLDGNLSEFESESEDSDSNTSSSNCNRADSTPPEEEPITPETHLQEFNSSTLLLEDIPSLFTETDITTFPESEPAYSTSPIEEEPVTPEPYSENAIPNPPSLEPSSLEKTDTIPFADFCLADSTPFPKEQIPIPEPPSSQDTNTDILPLNDTQALLEELNIAIPLVFHKRKPPKQTPLPSSSKKPKKKKKKSKQPVQGIQQPKRNSLISRILSNPLIKFVPGFGLIILALYLLYLGAVEV